MFVDCFFLGGLLVFFVGLLFVSFCECVFFVPLVCAWFFFSFLSFRFVFVFVFSCSFVCVADEISPCFSQCSLRTVFTVVTVPSASTVVFYQIPHLTISVVLHSDRQSSCGCFGSRSTSMCHKNTSWYHTGQNDYLLHSEESNL